MGLVFAVAILVSSVALCVWEVSVQKRGDDTWLATPRRFRRRMMISAILLAVGALMLVEAMGWLPQRSAMGLMLWLSGLFGLSVILLVLAAMDAGETARAASRRESAELENAIEEYRASVAEESASDDKQ